MLALDQDDLILSEAQIRVRGKGNKVRAPATGSRSRSVTRSLSASGTSAPLWPGTVRLPEGPARGTRMTPAGLRSLFRHHRQTTGVAKANPHRFRHTFATDMIRAGISLPALMHLMGHAQIQTTMVYVRITPQDVYQQYVRAVAQLVRPTPPSLP